MKDNKRSAVETSLEGSGASIPNRLLGSLRDALHAASREFDGRGQRERAGSARTRGKTARADHKPGRGERADAI